MSEVKIDASWKAVLQEEFEKEYFRGIRSFLYQAKTDGKKVYPPGSQVFNAFDTTPFDAVKVVILGQDPYHGPGQAMGLSFSVPKGVPIPGSLQNINKELKTDLGINPPTHGDLTHWARQGVFLLNASLTVEAHKANSHKDIGWQQFTDAAIKALAQQREHLVFMLWGRFAQAKAAFIDSQRHLILQSAHPSPLSAHAGFLGCRHFSQCNAYLEQHGLAAIDWQLP